MTKDYETVDQMLSCAQDICDEFVSSYTRKELETDIKALIKGKVNDVVMVVLGFDNSYRGRWSIDHCNGRMSDIRELVNDEGRSMVKAMLSKRLKSFIHTKKFVDIVDSTLEKEYTEVFLRTLSSEVRSRAEADARAKVAEALNQQIFGKYDGLQQLKELKSSGNEYE